MRAFGRMNFKKLKPLFSALVILSTIGFFVDSFNIALFQTVRLMSLQSLDPTLGEKELISMGGYLLSAQMIGVLIGGFIWGPLSDSWGRVKALRYAVFTYAVACIFNAFVPNIPLYILCRFVAGIGMAGEFGISVSLVSESLSKELRGYAIVLVSALGTLGFVLAGILGDMLTWRELYFLGGVLGFCVLVSRLRLKESRAFKISRSSEVKHGLLFFFSKKERVLRFLRCVSLGLPTWFTNAILITFCFEIGKEKGLELTAAKGFVVAMPAAIIGDLLLGGLSQALKSRRLIMLSGLGVSMLGMIALLFLAKDEITFYCCLAVVFVSVNFWGVFITATAEQFGTNIRATAATLAPNFVRGAVILVTLLFTGLTSFLGTRESALAVGVIVYGIAVISILIMKESSQNELDFIE